MLLFIAIALSSSRIADEAPADRKGRRRQVVLRP
jgi:hypothetical protein